MTLEVNWTAGQYVQAAGRIKRMTDFDNLAKLIKEAAKVREESYVATPGKPYGNYALDISQACEKVTKYLGLSTQYERLASLMLFQCWNDALDWADTQLYPIEMAYVEGCYRVANALGFGDFGHDLESPQTLIKSFTESADNVRKSLYGFGKACS